MIDLSIIIPIFNAEIYLEQCLNSIALNNNDNIEIILIDDCSFDKSIQIAKLYCNNYTNFKLYENVKNQGQGPSRNFGLLQSKGEYVYFMDSDDEVNMDVLLTMLSNAQNLKLDIYEARHNRIDKNGSLKYPKNFVNVSNVISGQLYWNSIAQTSLTVWDKIWRRDFIIHERLLFADRKYEDVSFVAQAMTKALRVCNTEKTLYNYYIRDNSTMTAKTSLQKLKDAYALAIDLEKLYIVESKNIIGHEICKTFFYSLVGFYRLSKDYDSKNAEEYLHLKRKINQIHKKYRFEFIHCQSLSGLQRYLAFFSPNIFLNVRNLFS